MRSNADMLNIPTLQTERLLLRLQTLADWPCYERLMMSERARYMGGPYSQAVAWGLFCGDLAQWDLFGHGALMIEDRESGNCLGQVGINHGPLFPEQELGWFVYSEGEGNGYAYEASLALRNWAFDTSGIKTLVSYIDPDNLRSRKLALKLGAILDTDAVGPAETDLVFRYPLG